MPDNDADSTTDAAHDAAHDRAHQGAVRTILGLGEERMADVVKQLLANDAFVGAVQRAISGGLTAKRTVDKGMATVLGLANIPSLEDVDKIRERMDEVEEVLGEIRGRVEQLLKKVDDDGAKKSKKAR